MQQIAVRRCIATMAIIFCNFYSNIYWFNQETYRVREFQSRPFECVPAILYDFTTFSRHDCTHIQTNLNVRAETRYLQLQQRKASSAIVNDTLTPRQIVDIVEIVPLLIIAAVIFLTFNTNKDLFSVALRDYASPFVKTPIFQDTILFGC